MNNTSTLISLAMLRVNAEMNRDYIEYLRPFVLDVLQGCKMEPIVDSNVAQLIREKFGLNIPNRAIHLILRRLARIELLKKESGIFYIVKELPPTNIVTEQAKAKRHIQAIIKALVEYSKDTYAPFNSEEEANESLLAFLSKFSIDCLKTYIFGTALPEILQKNNKAIVLVSKFVKDISCGQPSLFSSFMIMVKGHMLANALICPDLDSLNQEFKKVVFYLDTPFVIRLLGLEGSEKKSAAIETTELVSNLGGKLAVFEHTYKEIYNVIRGAAHYIDRPDGRGSIVIESRREGRKSTDLLLLSEKLEDKLGKISIDIKKTPSYEKVSFQIDEAAFESVLEDEIKYYNEKAKLFDINSVRSIYALRVGKVP